MRDDPIEKPRYAFLSFFFFFKKRGKGNNCTEIFALRNARTFLPRPNKSRFKKNRKRTGFYYRVWESSRMPGAIEF